MRCYRFALQGEDVPLEALPERLEDDVAALKFAAEVASELTRNRENHPQFVVLIRAAEHS